MNIKTAIKEWVEEYDKSYKENGSVDLINENEFTEDGLLSSYFKKVNSEQHIDMIALVRYILLISEISEFIKSIEQQFGPTNIELLKGN